MNETPPSDRTDETRESCSALRSQLNSALILLLIVSSTITVFFLRQSTLARKDRDMLNQTIADYQSNTVPVLSDLTAKLREYAKTHPDVVPILSRYGVVAVTNTAAGSK